MTGVGTPDCARSDQNCTLPPPSSVPESAKHDELWIVKDTAKDAVLGVHGPRTWEAPNRTSLADAHAGNFEPWEPEEPLKTFYEMSHDEWQPDGCGELPLWKCDPHVKAKSCKNNLLSPWQCGA